MEWVSLQCLGGTSPSMDRSLFDSPGTSYTCHAFCVCGLALLIQPVSCSSINDWEKVTVWGSGPDLFMGLEWPFGSTSALFRLKRYEPWLPHNRHLELKKLANMLPEYIPLANWLFWTESDEKEQMQEELSDFLSFTPESRSPNFPWERCLLVWGRKAHSTVFVVSGKMDLYKPSNKPYLKAVV